jgi:hypothetical protein
MIIPKIINNNNPASTGAAALADEVSVGGPE